MADDDKTKTVVTSAAKGGVSAVMPYVAIGVLGFFTLKQLKEMEIDVGGSAGQIIESFTEGLSETVTNVIDKTSETIVHVTEKVTETIDKTIIEPADTRVEKHGKTLIDGEAVTFSEFLQSTREGEGILPFYTGFLATLGHYGTGGLITEPAIEAGRKTREILPESIRETIDVRVYGASPKASSRVGIIPKGTISPKTVTPKISSKTIETQSPFRIEAEKKR